MSDYILTDVSAFDWRSTIKKKKKNHLDWMVRYYWRSQQVERIFTNTLVSQVSKELVVSFRHYKIYFIWASQQNFVSSKLKNLDR